MRFSSLRSDAPAVARRAIASSIKAQRSGPSIDSSSAAMRPAALSTWSSVSPPTSGRRAAASISACRMSRAPASTPTVSAS
jgi:hypothetical protein